MPSLAQSSPCSKNTANAPDLDYARPILELLAIDATDTERFDHSAGIVVSKTSFQIARATRPGRISRSSSIEASNAGRSAACAAPKDSTTVLA